MLIAAAILLPMICIAVGYYYDYKQDKKSFFRTIAGVVVAIVSLLVSYTVFDFIMEQLYRFLEIIW